jgi:carboxypeptidase family protein
MKDFDCFYRLSRARTARRSSAGLGCTFAILLTIAAFASAAPARPIDSLAGSVRGTVSVVDPNGQSYGAPGAQVRLIGATKDSLQLAIADHSGRYKFDSVPPGNYRLEVTLDGFEKLTRPIMICAGEANVENVTLVMKGAREEDIVQAERVGLNLKAADHATEIKQAAPQTDPVASERLRDTVLLSMQGSRASHGRLTVNSAAAGYYKFDPTLARHFLSVPNQVVNAPKFSPPEIHILKSICLSVSPRVSLKNPNHSRRAAFPDVQGSYPRDLQGNLASTNFDVFSNGVGRTFGVRLVIEKK